MGGYGSGSQTRWASKTDEFHRLDLATFTRSGYRNGNLTWRRGDRVTGSISYRQSDSHLHLSYSIGASETREAIDDSFAFDFSEQHFGGVRRWLLCKCGRRCRVLYGGKYFRCRHCYRLTYESQYERIRVPGMAKAEKVRDRLGMKAGFAYPFGPKPKGMHWRTYRRYRARDWAMSDAIDRALCGRWGL